MLDVFKGLAITALTWTLTFWLIPLFSPVAVSWCLPCISFVLPLLLPNGRWLFGSVALYAGTFAFIAKFGGSSLGAALVLALLAWAAVAMALGIAARYAIRASRAWYRKRKDAPPVPEKKLPPISGQSVALTAATVAGLLAGYSLYVMHSTSASAERVAAGRPYCVQVASNDNYRSVANRLDLLGLRMMGNRSVSHAVLAVKNGSRLDTYHWSYFNNAFELDGDRQLPIYCDVIPDFLAHPRRHRQEAENSLSFLLMGQSFSIPNVYAPTVSTAGFMQIEVPGSGKVSLTVGRAGQLEGWRATPGSGRLVETLGDEHGLIKERVRIPGSTSPADLQFYELDSAGKVKTLALCAEGTSSTCTQIFCDGRLSYYFFHPASELGNWQQMQRALSARAATFR